MNKTQLIDFVAEKSGLSKKDSQKAVEAVFEGITYALGQNEDATFVGFGTFKVVERAERETRNPKTGVMMKIAKSKTPRFKAGKSLKDAVNAG